MRQVAGHPGAQHVPGIFREFEIRAIETGRSPSVNISTLNEYRKKFGLRQYRRFSEINKDPKVSSALSKHYDHPDDVELYVGLVAEQTQDKPGGVGLNTGIGLGYTQVIGILQDAVNLIRNDRFYTTDYTPERLTEYGYRLTKDPASVGLPGFNGSIFAHLVSFLGDEFKSDDPRIFDPFRVL